MTTATKPQAKQVIVSEKGKAPVAAPTPGWMWRPFEEMERYLDSFLPRPWSRMPWTELTLPTPAIPLVDVIDRDNEIVVRAEAPGVDKKDLDVSMTDSLLTIKGESHVEEKEEKGEYYRCERSHGAFSRTVRLPAEVDTSKARASYEDGLLEVTLPKLEQSKRRAITIS
jgi:HSP20 family protein